jgi:hypothetical protein
MAALEHMAFGLAAKPLAPRVNVFVLMIATEFLDLITIPFYLLKSSDLVPLWTHSLIMALIWSLFVFLISYVIIKDRKSSIILSLLVFSHWILDFITHPMTYLLTTQINPDLPIFFGMNINVGLGLYKTLPGVIIGNLLLWGISIFIYVMYRIKIKTKIKIQNNLM